VTPSTVPFGLGLAFFLAGRLVWPPRGAGLDDMAPEPGAAGLVIAPELGIAPGAGPFGGTPASLAS
jgi:hypothetical protein